MKKITILLFVFSVVLVGVYVLVKKAQQPTPVSPAAILSPTLLPSVSSSFGDIAPGTSTEADVVRSLGPPIRKDVIGGSATLIYPSGLGKQPIDVDLDARGAVLRIVEPLAPSVRFDQLAQSLGKADLELYGLQEDLGFRLYVYLGKGVAILANPQTQSTLERWYFAPTDAATFRRTLAPALATEHIVGKE